MAPRGESDADTSTDTTPWHVPSPKAVFCHCGDEPVVLTSWTNANPGREFYKCGVLNKKYNKSCDFFMLVDPEEPHGWQKAALRKARDKIRALKAEVDFYKTSKAATDAKIKTLVGGGGISEICAGESYAYPEPEIKGPIGLVQKSSNFLLFLSLTACACSIVAVIYAMKK